MIENYKGWDITLSWSDKNITNIKYSDCSSTNKNQKWVGVNLFWVLFNYLSYHFLLLIQRQVFLDHL